MKKHLYLITALLAAVQIASAQPEVSLELFSEGPDGGFEKPTTVTNAGDERLFVLDQPGLIYVLDENGEARETPFLDITDQVGNTGNEQGLLGIAFSPSYEQDGNFYLDYTNNDGNTVVSRWSVSQADSNLADAGSEEVLLTVQQPFGNHNGGHIEFGPEGFLYIGMGDGGSAGDPQANAQNPQALLGKILRIDVSTSGANYDIPSNNPFVDDESVRSEIWALGVRNPWRYSFDRQTGDLWIGDVGQGTIEEIDFEPDSSTGGHNYGWRCYEGNSQYNTDGCNEEGAYDFPVYQYTHNPGGYCSVTGGRVYRGTVFPALQGHYFFLDYCGGDLWSLTRSGEDFEFYDLGVNAGFGGVSFGEDINGQLYLSDQGDKSIFKLVGDCADMQPEITAAGDLLSTTPDADAYQWFYINGDSIQGATTNEYFNENNGPVYVVVTFGNCQIGSLPYTPTPEGLNSPTLPRWKAYPNPARAFIVFSLKQENVEALEVFNSSGQRVFKHALPNRAGKWRYNTANLASGVYQVIFSRNRIPQATARIMVAH